jgi:hypothetical protein
MVWGRAETYVIVAMEELTGASPWTGRHKAQAAMKKRIKLLIMQLEQIVARSRQVYIELIVEALLGLSVYLRNNQILIHLFLNSDRRAEPSDYPP